LLKGWVVPGWACFRRSPSPTFRVTVSWQGKLRVRQAFGAKIPQFASFLRAWANHDYVDHLLLRGHPSFFCLYPPFLQQKQWSALDAVVNCILDTEISISQAPFTPRCSTGDHLKAGDTRNQLVSSPNFDT